MFIRKIFGIATISVCLTGLTFGQTFELPRIASVPLTIEKGFPLEVVLTEKVRTKLNEPVHGKIINSVYAFDREVIPSGTEVLGKVTGFRPVGKWKRVSSILGGDFTPLRQPEIAFDSLVFSDGKQISIDTAAVSKGNLLLRLDKGQTRSFTTSVQQPGGELFHHILWSLSPIHPQFTPTGSTYRVTLQEPLSFGTALVGSRTLNAIGSTPPAGSMVYARLLTSLDTKTTKSGTSVFAVLTEPLYSLDRQLLYPAGSRLQGEVAEVHPAGHWNHGGELALKFVKIEPPLSVMSSMSQIKNIEGRLVGVQVPQDLGQLRIENNGAAQIASTKGRFFAPVVALAGATPMLGPGSSSFGTAFAEAYTSSFMSRATGGSAGFGLPVGIAGLMVPPLGLGVGAFGVGHSIYSNLIGRGKDISLPADTPIEIRLD